MSRNKIFQVIDLEYKGLEEVKDFYDKDDEEKALKALREYYRKRKSVKGFIEEKQRLKNYIKLNLKADEDRIIKVADDIVENRFLFQEKWDMERTCHTVEFRHEIEWTINPFGDEEWTFMLNRHRIWHLLAQAYLLSGNRKYIEAFEKQIHHWIDNNKEISSMTTTTWRTIEAGIRLRYWVKTLDLLLPENCIDEKLLEKIIISIEEHMIFLKENYDDSRVISNWVILEQQGVYLASLFLPELKVCKLMRKNAMDILEKAIHIQVMEDGFHWEQSFQYHNEMLICYLDAILLSIRNGIEVNSDIYKKVKAMAYATFYSIKPNDCQSNYGDSDEEDLREVLTISSLVFKDGFLKNKAMKEVNCHILWDYGINALNELESISVQSINEYSKAFEDIGLYFMRSGFHKEDSYTMFKCGFLGSGHGHSDMLHIEISALGEDVLVDSGRYTYSSKDPLRLELKSPKSHNTTIVDNKNFTLCEGAWGNNGVALPIKQNYKFTERYDFVEGGHLGYINEEHGIFVNRKVIYIKPNIWIVSDEFFGKGTHEYNQFLNFDRPKVKKNNQHTLIYQTQKGQFLIKSLNDNSRFHLEKNTISKDYNHKYESIRAVNTVKSEGNTVITNVFIAKDNESDQVDIKNIDVVNNRGKFISKNNAEAVKIKVNEEEYIVLIAHKDEPKGRKLYKIEDEFIYGKVVIIKRNDGVEKTILAY